MVKEIFTRYGRAHPSPLLGDGVAYAICHFISLSTQQLSKVPFLFQNQIFG